MHKLDEFLSGEIHEEMDQELRLKEQNLKLKNLNSWEHLKQLKLVLTFLKRNIQTHILDSELLLSKTLDKSREEILVKLDQNINRGKFLVFKEYLQRRCHNEPVAYIIGEKGVLEWKIQS